MVPIHLLDDVQIVATLDANMAKYQHDSSDAVGTTSSGKASASLSAYVEDVKMMRSASVKLASFNLDTVEFDYLKLIVLLRTSMLRVTEDKIIQSFKWIISLKIPIWHLDSATKVEDKQAIRRSQKSFLLGLKEYGKSKLVTTTTLASGYSCSGLECNERIDKLILFANELDAVVDERVLETFFFKHFIGNVSISKIVYELYNK